MQKCTPITVSATAGLRLLPDGQADEILGAIKRRLVARYPFNVVSVSIIDGKDEAVHAWTTVNYLLNKFGSSTKKITAAVMDLV